MKFFNKYIFYFIGVPFVLSIIFYLIALKLSNAVFLILYLVMITIGLVFFSYYSWREVIDIYKTYIYIPKLEKMEIKMQIKQDPVFASEYKENKKLKKQFYQKRLINHVFFGIFSIALIVLIFINFI